MARSELDPVPTAQDLERAILRGVPELTAEQVADAAELTLGQARSLWQALGFADPGDEAAFTTGDVEALAQVSRVVAENGLDFETMLRLTRAVGQTVARLADWEVATLATTLERVANGSPDDVVMMRRALALVGAFGPRFEELLVYSWRRHLAAAVARVQSFTTDEEDFHLPQATVGFADLVGFTALSNRIGEHEIGDLVEVFESRCHDVIASHNGRVIKTLGDSVLFVMATPAEAIDIGLDIIGVIGNDERLPDVHLGLATGPVVMRMGDIYGPVVNLASRLTGVARRNRLIIDQATAALLPADEFETRTLPARPVRGFGDVEPVTVRRTRPRHSP